MEVEAVRDQVGVKASQRRRAASSPAHGRHAAGAAYRNQTTRAGTSEGERAGSERGLGRLAELGRKRGGGPLRLKRLFLFQI
jgi:hypothetical protein